MYEAYLFDLYGTLVDIKTEEESLTLWRKMALFYGYYGAAYEPNELKASYVQEVKAFFEEAERIAKRDKPGEEHTPEIILENVFSKLYVMKGIEASYQLAVHTGQFFRVLSIQYIKLYPGVVDLLTTLRKRGKMVYLVSNAQQIFTEYEMQFLGIKEYFDGIIFSSDVGYLKPDSIIYERAIKDFGIHPEHAIMIGNDFQCDVLGAMNAGLSAFYVHTNLSPDMPEDLLGVPWMRGMNGNRLLEKLDHM